MDYTYLSAFLFMLHENNFSAGLESSPWMVIHESESLRRNMLHYFWDFFDSLYKQNSNLELIWKCI